MRYVKHLAQCMTHIYSINVSLNMVSFIFIRTLGLNRDKVYKVFPNLEDEESEENGPLAYCQFVIESGPDSG